MSFCCLTSMEARRPIRGGQKRKRKEKRKIGFYSDIRRWNYFPWMNTERLFTQKDKTTHFSVVLLEELDSTSDERELPSQENDLFMWFSCCLKVVWNCGSDHEVKVFNPSKVFNKGGQKEDWPDLNTDHYTLIRHGLTLIITIRVDRKKTGRMA